MDQIIVQFVECVSKMKFLTVNLERKNTFIRAIFGVITLFTDVVMRLFILEHL